VILDIGANIGLWSLILSDAVGDRGTVCSFEPALASFEVLSNNVRINEAENVITNHIALSNTNGSIRLYHDIDSSRNSLGQTRTSGNTDYEIVDTKTIDTYVANAGLNKVDFIKIDVEGAEPLVFQGANETLDKFKPGVLFEINPNALRALGFQHEASWSILSHLGYRFYELNSNRLVEMSNCPTGGNVWAVHPNSTNFLLT
jgi:FkbM family methyltransferase